MDLSPQQLDSIFPNPPQDLDPHALVPESVPEHVAIIMDGNGRWAKQRHKPRALGHKAGVEGVREAIRTANDVGVRYLTIYSFSTENWSRPLQEVQQLMHLFAETMAAEVDELDAENVRIKLIGRMQDLPQATADIFQDAIDRTAGNTGMTLIMAVSYGSRTEIVEAVRAIAEEAETEGLDPETIDEEFFSRHLYTSEFPDPDLLIRTSGERRLSNFLLWQTAYSELYVTDVLWPDFDRYDFLRALLDYQGRDRRFGGSA